MVHINSIAEMGAYVELLEFNKMEGVVLLTELSRRRIRSINKLIRPGTNEAVMVVRVDQEKGYIDLSKRRVSAEERMKCEDRYTKAKTVQNILKTVCQRLHKNIEDLCEKVSWPLYRKYGHAFLGLQAAVKDSSVFSELDIEQDVKDMLLEIVMERMAPHPVRCRMDVDVTCLTSNGILAIKDALLAGQATSAESGLDIKVHLIAPPKYSITTNHISKETAFAALQAAADAVKASIEAAGGRISISAEPHVVAGEQDSRKTTVAGFGSGGAASASP